MRPILLFASFQASILLLVAQYSCARRRKCRLVPYRLSTDLSPAPGARRLSSHNRRSRSRSLSACLGRLSQVHPLQHRRLEALEILGDLPRRPRCERRESRRVGAARGPPHGRSPATYRQWWCWGHPRRPFHSYKLRQLVRGQAALALDGKSLHSHRWRRVSVGRRRLTGTARLSRHPGGSRTAATQHTASSAFP